MVVDKSQHTLTSHTICKHLTKQGGIIQHIGVLNNAFGYLGVAFCPIRHFYQCSVGLCNLSHWVSLESGPDNRVLLTKGLFCVRTASIPNAQQLLQFRFLQVMWLNFKVNLISTLLLTARAFHKTLILSWVSNTVRHGHKLSAH